MNSGLQVENLACVLHEGHGSLLLMHHSTPTAQHDTWHIVGAY